MRVAAVVPLYPPASRVGAWLATHTYLRHLAAAGHQVDVYRYLGRGDVYELDGVTVHPVPPKRIQGDVIVGHLGDNGAAVKAARGRPLVQMVHGRVDDIERRLVGDLVVCNSEATARWVTAPSIVCPPITDPAAHTVEPGDAVTLVNLAEAKGGRLFHLLAQSLPDRRFLGVKGGWGKQYIRQAPNLTVTERVEDMRSVWSQTRVLVMPSEHETWGMAGVEAMCSGIPVIAHPTPGLVESLGSAGIFVNRSDLPGWRKALTELDWDQASQAAKHRAAELAADTPNRLARFMEAVEKVCR